MEIKKITDLVSLIITNCVGLEVKHSKVRKQINEKRYHIHTYTLSDIDEQFELIVNKVIKNRNSYTEDFKSQLKMY